MGVESQYSARNTLATSVKVLRESMDLDVDNAAQAHMLAVRASDTAQEGNDAITSMRISMSGITNDSKNINSSIIEINQLALQTHILSMNAQVEAAYAGVSGQGFAIVSAEMRRLAEAIESSTKTISKLLNSAVQQMKDATVLIDETETTLDSLKFNAESVTGMTDEVSVSAKSQSHLMDKVEADVNLLLDNDKGL
jgi:methyl-accepting chemotaxis protein